MPDRHNDDEHRGRELPLRLMAAVVVSALVTFATGVVGMAAAAYSWRTPLLFNFTLALLVLSWGGTFVLGAIEVALRDTQNEHAITRKRLKELMDEHNEDCDERATRAARAGQIMSSIDQSERRLNSIN